ncbi:MAG: PorT family protein [Prevotellaceae bacterium]|jgi:hypothetical protein|nr:PorT family protein [Prevotellaceae bacterium]
MKKIVFIVLFSCCINAAFAQFAFGVGGTYNTSLGFDEKWNFNSKNLLYGNDLAQGFGLGLFLRGGNWVFVQPELYYNLMISNAKIGDEGKSFTITSSTFNVPVLLGVKAVNLPKFNLRFLVGPRFKFALGKNPPAFFADYEIDATPRKWLLGLETGFGFDIGIVTIDFRYNLMQDVLHYVSQNEKIELNRSPVNSFSVGLGFKIVDKRKR